MLVIIANNTQTIESKNILQAGVKDTIKSYHSKSSSTFFGLSKREFKETSLKEQAQYALVNSDANLSYKALSSLVLEGVRLNAKRISLGAKTLEIKPLVLESIETKEWSKGTLLSPSFMQESLERVSLTPSFIESKDLSINTLSTTIKASHIKARNVNINTQALALISLKNREYKSSFSSNASSFLLAKNTKEGFIKEVAMPSTLSFSNSFVLNGRELSKEVQELSNRSNFIAKDKESKVRVGLGELSSNNKELGDNTTKGLNQDVQELSKGFNNKTQESLKAKDNHTPLIISSEMPLALDSSIIFSKALLENKQWSERSKSLTPLSHLLLEAALAYVSAGINLPIHSTFVSSVAKGSMQGALGSGVFQVSNKLLDSKNALSFRSFTKDTLGGGLKGGIGLLPLNLSLVEGIETLPLREIVLNASVDTLVYKESFKESLLGHSLLALGNSLYKGVGDIAQIQSIEGNSLFKEGGLGKVVLHSGVGGVMAALNKENFFKGALISGIYESIAPLRGNPIEHKEREVLISKVYGGVVGGLLGGNSLMALGSALSESAERYNRQLHAEDGRLIAVEKGVNDGEVEILNEKEEKAFEEKYKGKVEKYKGAFIFTQPIPEKYQDTYNLNNPQDFETLRSRTDMSYTNLDSKVIIATGMNTDTIKAQERVNFTQNLLGQQVGIIHNDTHGYFKDTLEYKSGLTLKDSLNAHTLQQITKNSQNSVVFKDKDFVTQYPKTILVHSAANEDIKKANFLNATMGAKTNYNLISVGSPIAESELRESTNAVGATLVRQVNDHRDPITNPRGAVVDVVGGGAAGAVRGGITGGILGGIAGGITGLVGGIGITLYNLDEYHSFESYFKNPEFQLQQTIQNLLMENAMKGMKEQGLSNDKD
ncbi:hypothetical protein [Helicobacter apodemus]|uniref:Uncharacterized protein n=1 Tax=Helicobacter apodemus TaxID=135569 RepID=A0A2U8FBR4_9HELI|nr:hypothetical protein [Helicobacter apodemus]AWI33337.1 hypothetical protein CDV25_00145 [Helicobacter apodemus]